jgi:preprotein translocase subunit SecG
MEPIQIVFGIILLIFAVFLTVAVLMQSGKSHNLSGAIAGGAETFFGKNKGKTIDKMLSKLTTIVAVCFAVLVIVVFVIQDDNDIAALYDEFLKSQGTDTSETADASETTTADEALDNAGAETAASDAAETTAAEG